RAGSAAPNQKPYDAKAASTSDVIGWRRPVPAPPAPVRPPSSASEHRNVQSARGLLVNALKQKGHSSPLGRSFRFAAGETIYTGQSQKYTPAIVQALAVGSGFGPAGLRLDEAGSYGLGFSASDRVSQARRWHPARPRQRSVPLACVPAQPKSWQLAWLRLP
ncbi:MAG: L-histidine N(alpha)-methyltransferase, partial [Anaerolineales bacterium]|nr:L-histidine N(alpha)-methyltransferase [Anaerolineales bacterium]